MSNRDFRINRLITDFIQGISDFIGIRTLLRYNESKEFTDPRDIPDLGYVQFLINGGMTGETVSKLIFTEADLLEGDPGNPDAGYYLPLPNTVDITVAMKSTNGTKNPGGDVESITGFTSNEPQTITVWYFAQDAPVLYQKIFLANTSSNPISFSINNTPYGTVNPSDPVLELSLNVNDFITFNILSSQNALYRLYNAEGAMIDEIDITGPRNISGNLLEPGFKEEYFITNS